MPTGNKTDDNTKYARDPYEPEWYDSFQKGLDKLPTTDGSEPNTPGDYEQQKKVKEASPEELAQQENGVEADSGQEQAAASEQEQALNQDDEPEGGLYEPSKAKKSRFKKLRSRVTKRNGLIAGAVAAPFALIASFLIINAPQLIINNLRKIVLEDIGKVQIDHQKSYRRSKISRVSDLFSRDGRLGGRVIADMESRGYKFEFGDLSDRNRVTGLTMPDGRRTLLGQAMGDHIHDYLEVRHPLRFSRWKTKRTNALYQRFKIPRASIVAPVRETIDDPITEINKRLAQGSLDGTEVSEDARAPSVDEDDADQVEARNRQQSIINQNSDQNLAEIRRAEVLEGIPPSGSQLGEDVARALDEVSDGIGENALRVANNIATNSGSIAGRAFNTLRGWFDPTAVFDRVCTLKNRLRMSSMLARTNRATAMLRNSSLYVGVADAVRRGTVDSRLFNVIMQKVTAVDRNGNPIGASPGIIYALKGRFNKTTNLAQKSRYAVDGTLPGVFGDVQNATDSIPLTGRTSCVILQNPITQIGATVVINFGRAIACTVGAVFTGGSSCAAANAGIEAARVGVTQAVKTGIRNTINRVITKAALKRIAIQAVTAVGVEVGFEAFMALTQMYAEKAMALPLTGQEVGGELGSLLTAGGGVANKQRSLAAGFVPSTTQQYAAAEQQYYANHEEEFKKLGFAERYLNTSNFDSLAGKLATDAIISAPTGVAGAAALPQYATNFLSDALSFNPVSRVINSITGNQAYAQSEEEVSFDSYKLEAGDLEGTELAVDFAGNPQVIMRSDIEAIDPQENIEFLSTQTGDDGETYIDPDTLEPRSEDFKKHIEYCVDTIDILSRLEFEYDEGSNSPQKDCMARKQITVRLKAHLAYLDMIDSLEAEFFPEEVGPSSDGTAATTTNTGASASYIPDCSVNNGNAAIACTAIDQLLGIPYDQDRRAAADDPSPEFLDCSAFTGMAVYRTFGTNLGGICSVEYRNNSNFQEIDIKTIQPGDFIGKGTGCAVGGGGGHIALVVSYDSTTGRLVTAETDGRSQPSRIETSKGLQVDGDGTYIWAVRYIGPKSSPGLPGS